MAGFACMTLWLIFVIIYRGDSMAVSQELLDFIISPDTVDFVARKSDYFLDFVQNHPEIVVTQTLSGRYVVGYVDKKNTNLLMEVLGTGFISVMSTVLGTLARSMLEASGIIQVQNQPYLDLQGRGVLIGFVDTGIDYTQDVFIYEDGTSKIQYIFDQTAVGEPPEGFFIGKEYTNEQINEALRSDDPYSIVPQRDNSGHGTFLASVAAGRKTNDFLGAAPDTEIIAVKLRKARPYYLEQYCVPEDQNDAFESSAVMVGVEYILKKARELNRPVVICLGIGTNFGSHDGYSIFEEYLSGISNLKGVCLCVAAGNESQQRHHMQGAISSQDETQNIDLRIGSNAGNVCISIWNSVSDRLSVSVRSPSGELVSRVPARAKYETTVKLVLEPTEINIQYHFPLEGSGGQLTFVRIINATPGIWTITMHGDIVLDGTFHAWLPLTGFVCPSVEFLSATPYYTVTVPSTSIGVICCGAYDSSNNSLYLKSSWGPSRASLMLPDLVAPGVEVSGYFPYGHGASSGTSISAAITAGACALLLQWGIVEENDVSLSTYQIRAYLIRGCVRSEAMKYPNPQWGYGALNLIQTFSLMREL